MSPSTYPTVPLASQVGGHLDGVHTTEDGSLIFKPALLLELQFYQSALSDKGFVPLRPFIPQFYGTLRLEGKVDPARAAEGNIAISRIEEVDEGVIRDSLVLENLSYPFHKPNILDIKLGTVLYDEQASPEKIARMKDKARRTTSFECGMRLTGFQVYDNVTSEPVKTSKLYGYSLKPSDLPEGVARFFPLATSSGIPSTSRGAASGLPPHLLLPVLYGVRDDIAALRKAFEQVHLRMVGASVLIVYEADWEQSEEGLKALEAMKQREKEEYGVGNANGKGDVDDDDDDDDDDDSDGDGYDDSADDEGDEDGDADDDDDEDIDIDIETPGPPYVVKLIDFAHTRITPGEGPDQGVLLGLDTLFRLLSGRIDQVRKAVARLDGVVA